MSSPAAFLLVGDDPYLVSEELHRVLEGSSPLAVDEFDSDADAKGIVQALKTPSLFGEQRTVLVRGVDSFSAEDQKVLTEYLDSPSPDSTLVMTSIRSVPKIASAVKRVGRVVEAAKGRRSDLLNWLAHESKQRGLRLGGEAMTVLLESVGESTGALAGALDELALAHATGARLGPKEIRRQFQHRPEGKLFAFVDAVAERRRSQALESLGRLTARGEAPAMLIWNLNRHFRMMLIAQGASPAGAQRSLNVQPWRAEKLVRQAAAFSEEELSSAYTLLAQADRKMKKSEEPEVLTLERTVVAICGRSSGTLGAHG